MYTVTRRDLERFDLAVKVACESDCNFRHGVVISCGSRIISIGMNRYKPRFTTSGNFNPRQIKISIHAEENAITKAGRFHLKGSTLYSARSLANGMYGISKPCQNCAKWIILNEIKFVVYFDGAGIIKEKV